jgi:hypothetical protein
MKLVQQLDKEDSKWRVTTILMLDNAPYHKSHYCLSFYRDLKLPIMFLGPYQFNLAPIETVFSYIKARHLSLGTNSLPSDSTRRTSIPNALSTRQMLKEMAVVISRLDFTWVKNGYYHMLTYALQALALTNI